MNVTAAQRPTPIDSFPTETSKTQAETEAVLLTHAPDRTDPSKPSPAPKLDKNAHVQFLARNMLQGFPARYMGQDASQPWLMYFTIHGFALLQVGLDPGNKQRYNLCSISIIGTFNTFLTPLLGQLTRFSPGNIRMAALGEGQVKLHISLPPIHRCVRWRWRAVQQLDGIKSTGALPHHSRLRINNTLLREKMYEWFMSLKQKDGSFLVSNHSEVDVR